MTKLRPDFATIAGLGLAALGIGGGLLLEGGSLGDITQGTAALIVLGGTVGAVLVNTPLALVRGAVRSMGKVLLEPQHKPEALIDEIIRYAASARKNGLVSLEDDAEKASDPFLRKALNLAVDGCDLQELRKMMELEMDLLDARAQSEAKVFESAGGYAPTIGIIGAVLGLIQVMKHLANTESIGHGIATAFVATVYGVGVANLFFLPAANKIKARAHEEMQMRELMLEGVASIVEGLNPKLIRSKLEAFLEAEKRSGASSSPQSKQAKAA
jgi:chemotaxis protein MotA